jgi:hypothetical protein
MRVLHAEDNNNISLYLWTSNKLHFIMNLVAFFMDARGLF